HAIAQPQRTIMRGHGASGRVGEYDLCGSVEQDDADGELVDQTESGPLQRLVGVEAGAEQERTLHMWVQPREKAQSVGLEGPLTSAATNGAADLKVILCGERRHGHVGDVLWAEDFVEQGGPL